MARNGWKLLEMAGKVENGGKLFETSGNDWKWLETARND